MSKRRVVVTGLGMLSPVGNTVESSWNAVCVGRSGISLITHFDTTHHATKFAGLIKNFNYSDYNISHKDARKMDLFIQYGIAAGQEAIKDANFKITNHNAHRIGAAIGSGIGGLFLIQENCSALFTNNIRKVSPFFVPSTIINMVAGHLSIRYGLKGPTIAISTACTSGLHNIGHAARMIAYGDADIMLAGGAEKASTSLGIAGFGSLKALSKRNESPELACRPWDQERDGFVLGDGAGIIVLEEYEHAISRSAKIYAEFVGFGMSSDAYHITSPPEHGDGAKLAMKNALRDAGINADKIGYINAHGTSTQVGDIAEARAIASIYEQCDKTVIISSTKSMTGHLLGASGAIEAIFTILSLRDQHIPPTINLKNLDQKLLNLKQIKKLNFIQNQSYKVKNMEYALCNSFGFGGTNGSIIFRKIT
uniref:3-oxoacyl-[acyl-carrier-protein] synthase 2 n=1 Tax=Candidatus Aschnera chinzeii TaxID=1485666 RepID=A0AAT9G3T9_9ENTR|nr:MAG: beta-ketoacyl-ACP synthase II [Candidatus Aschnera chinzeii]